MLHKKAGVIYLSLQLLVILAILLELICVQLQWFWIILGHLVFHLMEQHTIMTGTLMSGSLVVFMESYTISFVGFTNAKHCSYWCKLFQHCG